MSIYRLFGISTLLAFGALTAANAQQSPNPSRVAWEYKTVTLEQGVDPRNQFASGTKFYEDGQPVSTSSTRERANQLGAQGWELVSVAATENQTYRVHVYWFRRQRL